MFFCFFKYFEIFFKAIPNRTLALNQQEIKDLLIKRREYIKNNPVRTVLMVKAEEHVEKFNLDNPDTPIANITSEILELVAKTSWTEVQPKI